VSTVGWIGLALLTVLALVVLAYFVGRVLWNVAEPGDDDPGGRSTSMADLYRSIFTGTPFVDYLRLHRRLREQRTGGRKSGR
jgi:hypothetical protein